MKALKELGVSPAPWTKRGDCSIYGEILAADDTLVVSYDWNASCMSEPKDEPNARLIAAAPELYECLRECLSILHMVVNAVGGADAETLQTMVKSQRALEKAGGGK